MSLSPYLSDLLKKPAFWLDAEKSPDTAVLSSSLVLRRNFENYPFPVNCTRGQKVSSAEVVSALTEHFKSMNRNIKFQKCDLNGMTSDERAFLSERELILPETVRDGDGKFLYLSGNGDEMPDFTINEDSHIRFCSRAKGLNLEALWENMKAMERIFSSRARFAYHPKFGYLFENPEHTGTGLTVSALIHVPGLIFSGKLETLLHSLKSLRLKGTSYFGRNFAGRLIQIVSASSLGESEEELIGRFSSVIRKIDTEEKMSRNTLLKSQPQRIRDMTGRAYGLLRYANLLSEEEALNGLMMVQFGQDCGFFYNVPKDFLRQNFLRIRAAHTFCLLHESDSDTKQTESAGKNKSEQCAQVRASFLRNDLLGTMCRR